MFGGNERQQLLLPGRCRCARQPCMGVSRGYARRTRCYSCLGLQKQAKSRLRAAHADSLDSSTQSARSSGLLVTVFCPQSMIDAGATCRDGQSYITFATMIRYKGLMQLR